MIERSDIEAKVREITTALDDTTENLKNQAVLVALGVALVVVLAFWIGRRRGRGRGTIVEIYES